jgi:carbon storage regulator
MLVLSRKVGEEVVIAGNIRVKVLAVRGNQIRLGIVAPSDVAVDRGEIAALRREFAETEMAGSAR